MVKIISHNGRLSYVGVCYNIVALTIMILLVCLLSVNVNAQTYGQNCSNLTPNAAGQTDDAVNINDCLATVGYAILASGDFSIYQPIVFPQLSGKSLTGAGNTLTRIIAQYNSNFISSGNYLEPIKVLRAPSATLSGFHLDLSNLRKDFGYGGAYAIRVDKSASTQVTYVKITGSQASSSGYTTGWAHGGGVYILNSANSVVDNCAVKDLGFTGGPGHSGSAGLAGIQITSSGSTQVTNNNIARVSFNIIVDNGNPNQGYTGDSSYTTVSSNSITGPAALTCDDCVGGRGIKLQACGDGPPLQHLTISNNTLTQIGGFGNVAPSGIDLIAGVQYSDFTNNNVTVANSSSSNTALRVRSSFNCTALASHHNVFNTNTFSGGQYNVEFYSDGPDQGRALNGTPSISRSNHGTNIYSTSNPNSGSCSQYAHAWWDYPSGQNYVNRGQSISLSAAGVKNGNTVTFTFKDSSGNTVLIQQGLASSSCVMNSFSALITSTAFPNPGLYKVYATYSDGNSSATISDDWIGTGGQQVVLDVR